MKNTVFPHKFWRPFLDCMPQLFFRPQYVWFPVHLKGHLIPLCYETLVVNWQNWLFTLFHQSRSVLSPNPIEFGMPPNGHCEFSQVCATGLQWLNLRIDHYDISLITNQMTCFILWPIIWSKSQWALSNHRNMNWWITKIYQLEMLPSIQCTYKSNSTVSQIGFGHTQAM